MGIFSLINLEKDFEKLKQKPEVVTLFDFIKEKIVSYVNQEVVTDGAAKKAAVVTAVVEYIVTHFVTQNTILQFFVGLLIKFVPELVQLAYNQLATYITGLTAQA